MRATTSPGSPARLGNPINHLIRTGFLPQTMDRQLRLGPRLWTMRKRLRASASDRSAGWNAKHRAAASVMLHNLGMSQPPTVLDPAQLIRIEAVHRGFLYQHLFAVACLLSASSAQASAVVVEADEDIEIVLADTRLYAQIKTRSEALTRGDISGAMDRSEKLREEHKKGVRNGIASFFVVSNVAPGPKLTEEYESAVWPSDVRLFWPAGASPPPPLPAPWRDLSEGVAKCTELAAVLPFGTLAPETLVWKLAALAMAASAGTPPKVDHAFQVDELSNVFEQLALQLQDFPDPPARYRPQAEEPELVSASRIRAITGFSGAGKTAWVAQSAQQSTSELAYFDVGDTPGPVIAIPLARELAGRFFGSGGGLGQILLPGASGLEMLRAIDLRLRSLGLPATVVIDNAHRVPAVDLRSVLQQMPNLHFVLLCQPGPMVQELEALFGIESEPLRGWTPDAIATEAVEARCIVTAASCQELLNLTGGLPLYVQSAVRVAAADYAGDVARFCDELDRQTHSVTTAQEHILSKVFAGLPQRNREAIAILSMADIPLARAESARFVQVALGLDDAAFALAMRQLRLAGVLEVYGGDRLKIHDAMRVLGLAHLHGLDPKIVKNARLALKDVLLESILRQRDLPKLSLYLRILADLGDIRTAVQFATDEIFHELGLVQEISSLLERAANDEATAPDQRFAALDGLLFADLKKGNVPRATEHVALMARLVEQHSLDETDRLTLAMKKMNLAALKGDADEVQQEIARVSVLIPDNPEHRRIFRYNAAHALFSLRRYDACASETSKLIPEYYDVLGITPGDVMMKKPDEIFPLLKDSDHQTDDLKHLADCLDLQAQALNRAGIDAAFSRMHAIKFYAMANALDSLVRVGQDLADEFVARNDYIGARDVLERNVLPNVVKHKMVDRIVEVRSHYAVVLAYCGEHDAAAAEMARLAPYEAGLHPAGRDGLRGQRELIARLRAVPPPPQWVFPSPPRKMGRNERCYCGSGKKFKNCHGKNA